METTMWQADGTGVQPGGDIGGDIQAGDSYSVRYRRADLPGSMITWTAYPVEYDNCPGEFVVQTQTEWLVCEDPSDPGGTEIWSEVSCKDDDGAIYDSAADAEAAACEAATVMLGHAGIQYWNGLPE